MDGCNGNYSQLEMQVAQSLMDMRHRRRQEATPTVSSEVDNMVTENFSRALFAPPVPNVPTVVPLSIANLSIQRLNTHPYVQRKIKQLEESERFNAELLKEVRRLRAENAELKRLIALNDKKPKYKRHSNSGDTDEGNVVKREKRGRKKRIAKAKKENYCDDESTDDGSVYTPQGSVLDDTPPSPIPPSVLKNKDVNETNNNLVPIGNGHAKVPARLLKNMNWNSYTSATRKLLTAVFSRSVLATHSLTGKPSPAFPGKPAKKKLDPVLVSDIVQTVVERCGVPENVVRTSITTKCADESKMSRTRDKTIN